MDDSLYELLESLVAAHRRGHRLALLFDYDGTLTPIVEHPSLARAEDRTLRILGRLAQVPSVGVGVISGRGLDNLRSMVGLTGIYYAGTSGLELDLRGILSVHPEANAHRSRLTMLLRRLNDVVKAYTGAWVEDKPFGLTLHYRKVLLQQHPELLLRAGDVLAAMGGPLRAVEGPMALEIVPDLSWDKGSAVVQILEAIGRPVIPVYAGDAANDGAALAATTALGGIALGIGPNAPTPGLHRLTDPAALVEFLHELENVIAQRSGKIA